MIATESGKTTSIAVWVTNSDIRPATNTNASKSSDAKLRVPKNGVSRSKRLLKPQPPPHQHWVLELRTSLYWSALRVERLRRNRCGAGEMTRHVVFGHAEATASVITSVVWGFGRVVSIHRSSETRLPQFGNATPTVR